VKLRAAGIAAVMAGAAFCASQAWNKDAAQWTNEDVQHILHASPWAQTAEAAFAKGMTDETFTSTSLPDGSSAGLPGGKARWDGGVGRPIGSDLPTIPVTIRWDSSAPVRLALLKAHDALAAPGEQYYVIAILGLWPGQKAAVAGNEDESPKPPDLGHVRDELISSAKILRHRKTAMVPQKVELDPASGTIRLSFSRQDPISLDEKEIAFSTQFGPMHVLKRFRLKEMIYRGRLDL
jgi:hypothetical protein